jgi:hypothetical protein
METRRQLFFEGVVENADDKVTTPRLPDSPPERSRPSTGRSTVPSRRPSAGSCSP